MKTRLFFSAVLASWALAGGPAAAEVLDVPGDHSTIQAAIDAAADGDTVLVAPGTYEVTRPIVFGGKRIAVRSAAGADATTVRMMAPAERNRGSVFTFLDEEPDGTVLEGFTITGGQGTLRPAPGGPPTHNGGGVLCGPRAAPRIARNIFRGNSALLGGGIFCDIDSAPILFENVFTENTADGGGALACAADSSVLVEGGRFTRNDGGQLGGAVFVANGGALQVAGARFEENSADLVGGAIYSIGDRLELANCELVANRSEDGGGLAAEVPSPGRLAIRNCRFEGNEADRGGGAYVQALFPILPGGAVPEVSIEDSHFTGNTARLGGGLYVGEESSLVEVLRSRFERNSAQIGGGIFIDYDSLAVIEGSTVFRNRAGDGGGIWLEEVFTARIAESVVAENAEGGVGGEGTIVEIDHSTITGNAGNGAPVLFSSIESSIVWDNAGGSLSVPPVLDPLRVVARSIVEHGEPWPGAGNSNADPLLGGWASGPDVHVDAAAAPGGDGTRERPFRSVQEALDGYDLGLLPGSPCIGTGKDGTNIGAPGGAARNAGARERVLRVAAGAYSIRWACLAHGVSLEGAGRGSTVLEGTLFGLRSGRSFAGAAVTRGTFGGIVVSPFESPRIGAAAVRENTGRFGGGVIARRGSSPTLTDTTILDNAAREGGGSAILCEESRPAFARCTLSGNASPFGGTIVVTDPGVLSLAGSIIWGNSGPVFGMLPLEAMAAGGVTEVSHSLVEGPIPPGPGNIGGDPLFCGWEREEVHVDASSPGPGAGTEADPHPTLDRALGGFSVALSAGSPCIGTGEGGADMGAAAGTCRARGAGSLSVRLAPGDYAAAGITLSHSVSIEGSGWRETAIRGTVFGLRTGAALSGVTVTGGTDGGILLAEGESPDVEGVALTGNRGPRAAAISVLEGSPRFTNLLVAGNGVTFTFFRPESFSPVVLLQGASPSITSSTFTDNQALSPWITCISSSPVVTSCIFWTQGASFLRATTADSRPVVTHCLTGPEKFPGEGNFSIDPRFVAWPHDLRLLADSPCIDTGLSGAAPAADIDGQARPCWSGADMGAHEYCGGDPPSGAVRFRRGDANSDERVDIADAIAILLHLFASGAAPPCERSADVDDSAAVDLADAIFLLNHLFQGGGAPPDPFASCGIDPVPDGLSCLGHACDARGAAR